MISTTPRNSEAIVNNLIFLVNALLRLQNATGRFRIDFPILDAINVNRDELENAVVALDRGKLRSLEIRDVEARTRLHNLDQRLPLQQVSVLDTETGGTSVHSLPELLSRLIHTEEIPELLQPSSNSNDCSTSSSSSSSDDFERKPQKERAATGGGKLMPSHSGVDAVGSSGMTNSLNITTTNTGEHQRRLQKERRVRVASGVRLSGGQFKLLLAKVDAALVVEWRTGALTASVSHQMHRSSKDTAQLQLLQTVLWVSAPESDVNELLHFCPTTPRTARRQLKLLGTKLTFGASSASSPDILDQRAHALRMIADLEVAHRKLLCSRIESLAADRSPGAARLDESFGHERAMTKQQLDECFTDELVKREEEISDEVKAGAATAAAAAAPRQPPADDDTVHGRLEVLKKLPKGCKIANDGGNLYRAMSAASSSIFHICHKHPDPTSITELLLHAENTDLLFNVAGADETRGCAVAVDSVRSLLLCLQHAPTSSLATDARLVAAVAALLEKRDGADFISPFLDRSTAVSDGTDPTGVPHSQHMNRNDLKPTNCLVFEGPRGGTAVKVSDFGSLLETAAGTSVSESTNALRATMVNAIVMLQKRNAPRARRLVCVCESCLNADPKHRPRTGEASVAQLMNRRGVGHSEATKHDEHGERFGTALSELANADGSLEGFHGGPPADGAIPPLGRAQQRPNQHMMRPAPTDNEDDPADSEGHFVEECAESHRPSHQRMPADGSVDVAGANTRGMALERLIPFAREERTHGEW